MAATPPAQTRFLRFGPFELDVRAGELRKHGIRIKLREQPVQILLLLLEHPGEVVLREEIRLRLWPNDTVVEFDHGINAAIQKLRDALGESAGQPGYVETVARRGYRFLGEVERVGEAAPVEPELSEAPMLRPSRRVTLVLLSVGTLVSVAAVAILVPVREKRLEQRVVRLQIPPPGTGRFGELDTPAISPDGTQVVFSVGNGRALFVRSLDSLVARELPGTQGGLRPFWSPDGRYVAFFAGGKLKKANIRGGPPTILCDANEWGGAWNRDGVIVFAPTSRSPLMRISAEGGTSVPVTKLDAARNETSHVWPSFLPDGRHFLFVGHAAEEAASGLFLGSLDSPKVTRLLPDETNAQYAEPGYILFSRGGSLMAQPFDSGRLRFTGDAFPLAEGITADRPFPAPFFASSGVLVYRAAEHEGPARLRWFDRNGKQLGDVGPSGRYREPALSPDGHALAVAMRTTRWDIWVFDLTRGSSSRLTSGGRANDFPSWSPDGRQIAFSFDRDPAWVVHRMPANGAGKEELVVQLDRQAVLSQWTADGQFLIMDGVKPGGTEEIWAAKLSGGGKPFPVMQGPFTNRAGKVSPDGKWIAYSGMETGRSGVYIQTFPSNGEKSQISTAGGDRPRWRADGRELFYREGWALMSVEIRTSAGKLEAGIPKRLFNAPGLQGFDVSADGQRLLLLIPNEDQGPPQPLTVVTNWPAGFKR